MFVLNPFYVYVNSRDRTSGTDENFHYAINFPADQDFDTVVCLNCLIPKSYYLIQDELRERTFYLKEDNTTVEIIVPVGSYLLSTFKTTIGQLLTSASPNGLTYTLSYPTSSQPDTGKWTYTQNNGSIQSSIICNGHLFEPLGFKSDSTNDFTGTTLVSTCVIKIQSEDRLMLHSSCVINGGMDNILVSINSTTSINYSSIAWECPAPEFYCHELNSKNNNVYSFQLTDENGELISLNGLNLNIRLKSK